MKAYGGSRGIASPILNLGTRWRWMVNFMLQPFPPPGKNRYNPFSRRLGGPQTGHCGLPLPEFEPQTLQPCHIMRCWVIIKFSFEHLVRRTYFVCSLVNQKCWFLLQKIVSRPKYISHFELLHPCMSTKDNTQLYFVLILSAVDAF